MVFTGGKMTEEELNSLIAHAHRRIDQLQKQLAEQQVQINLGNFLLSRVWIYGTCVLDPKVLMQQCICVRF